jgi:hypothetical protein
MQVVQRVTAFRCSRRCRLTTTFLHVEISRLKVEYAYRDVCLLQREVELELLGEEVPSLWASFISERSSIPSLKVKLYLSWRASRAGRMSPIGTPNSHEPGQPGLEFRGREGGRARGGHKRCGLSGLPTVLT